MKIVFATNLDHYKTNCFPENLSFAPRVGEKVSVTNIFMQYFKDKKLPTRLEVVEVTYTDQGILCELWYNSKDVEIAKLSGTNLF